MRRVLFALMVLSAFAPLTGCVGFLVDALRPDHDNLVAQKDFQPDPDFAHNQPQILLARPYTAKDIAKIPGIVWLEGMGTDNVAAINASGFMIRYAGKPHILSAGHICRGPEYKAIYAQFSEGQKGPEEVEIIATDEALDIFCLLRFKDPNFSYDNYPHLGVSANLEKGDKVFTHGTPFGYSFSLSEGIINKTDFGVDDDFPLPQMIHHSAKINPGDSGGPLFNEQGGIIGMNVRGFRQGWRPDITTIYGAVPIDDIITVLRNLKESGHVKHPKIGWKLYPASGLNPLDYKYKGVEKPQRDGLIVTRVASGGPAEKAGVKVGDILLGYDGRNPETTAEVARYLLFDCSPGDEVVIRVYREIHSVENKLEKDKDGNWIYNHYPRLEKKVLILKVKLE